MDSKYIEVLPHAYKHICKFFLSYFAYLFTIHSLLGSRMHATHWDSPNTACSLSHIPVMVELAIHFVGSHLATETTLIIEKVSPYHTYFLVFCLSSKVFLAETVSLVENNVLLYTVNIWPLNENRWIDMLNQLF